MLSGLPGGESWSSTFPGQLWIQALLAYHVTHANVTSGTNISTVNLAYLLGTFKPDSGASMALLPFRWSDTLQRIHACRLVHPPASWRRRRHQA